MADKRETFTVTGVIAVYPKISKPDTYGPKADGKYKTNFAFPDKKREEAFKAALKKKAKELMPKVNSIKYPWKTNEDTGETSFRSGSKYQPLVFDAKNNALPADVLIGGGTKMNLVCAFNAYDGRLSLYLNAVQVIDLVRYTPKAREDFDSPFAATEGFEFEGGSDEEGSTEGDAEGAAERTSGDDADADPLSF
jgi:hypothetical protein